MVKRPKAAMKAYGQQRLNRLSPMTPLPSAANMRSSQTVRSIQSRGTGVEAPGIALAGTADVLFMQEQRTNADGALCPALCVR